MRTNRTTIAPPTRLLLATDLSVRCDRALARAAQIAGEWQAELVALNVLDPTTPDQALAWIRGKDDAYLLSIARQQLARDLAGLNVHASMRIVRSGDAATAIRNLAASIECGLVVTGVARSEILGRFLLGSIVERLVRMLPQPLLVVRSRENGPYRRIVVATDFSDSSRHALLAAIHLFPGREIILYHAWQTPFSGVVDKPSHASIRRVSQDIERGVCSEFLATSELPPEVTVRPTIEHGPLETTLTQYVRNHEVELVVMGSHGRSGLMNIMLGSSASALLEWLPCDALVVREPRSATSGDV
ncbi:universal stress protein [Polaromonas sp.]|uniref:universal stress protein n=1 Tax=Polaromonas sp. TaxID=1869339 RepID=UPI00248A602C|nr:universal stress protein [Polaromonas sp.]MDI1342463.1 universal stress protein [Polaromonas sp.]